jgi:cytochrome c-type biogenesis protein CcmH/NrfG
VPDAIGKAVEAYREAVSLYPNSALYRARLAEAYRAAGEPLAFRREAEAALRLDQLTPHRDKKLPAELRNRLLHGHRDGS